MKPLDKRSGKASQCSLLTCKDESLNDTASTELILDALTDQKCVRQNKGRTLFFSPGSDSETDVQMKLKYEKW